MIFSKKVLLMRKENVLGQPGNVNRIADWIAHCGLRIADCGLAMEVRCDRAEVRVTMDDL